MSAWAVHRFEVWSGELLCVVEALRCGGALLLWAGGGAGGGGGGPRLGDIALALPVAGAGDGAAAAVGTALLGEAAAAAGLAQRLARRLQRPVYVCCGLTLDRFTAPLLERALVTEIESKPDFFFPEIVSR